MADKDNVDGKYPSSKPKGTLSLKGGSRKKKSAYSVSPGSIDGQRAIAPKSMSETMGGNYGKIRKVRHMLDTMEMSGGKRQELYDIIAHLEEGDYVDNINTSGLNETGLTPAMRAEYSGDEELEDKTYNEMSEYGTTDTSNILAQRMMNMDYGIQAAAVGIIEGTYSPSGKDQVALSAAVENLTKSLGGSTDEFLRSVKSQLPDGTTPTRSKQDVNTALSMMGNTAEDYLTAGGGLMSGQTVSKDAEMRQRKSQGDIYGELGALADKYYITDATKSSKVYELRKHQVVQGIASHLMNTDISGKYNELFLPLPNMLKGIVGLKPTQGNSLKLTSPYDPMEHSKAVEKLKLQSTVTMREQGILTAKGPSGRNTFIEYDESLSRFGIKPLDVQKAQFSHLKEEVLGLRSRLREQTATVADGNNGFNTRVIGQWNPDQDQAAAQEFRNYHSTDLSMSGMDEYGGDDADPIGRVQKGQWTDRVIGTDINGVEVYSGQEQQGLNLSNAGSGVGSNTSGMYGRKVTSEKEDAVQTDMARYNELMEESGFQMNHDDAVAMVLEEKETDLVYPQRPELSTNGYSPYDYYKRKVRGSVTPEQGTDEWKAQRLNNVTGSVAGKLLSKEGPQIMAYDMATKKLGLEFDVSSAYTKQGNDYEDKVRDTFLASKEGKGIHFEEAFYERHPDNPRFGATPDGRLFNADGSSAGLAEFKLFKDSTFSKGKERLIKDINPQVQWQMYVSGEQVTRATWLNSETNEYHHAVIEADPKLQNQMAATARESIKIADQMNSAAEIQKMKIKYGGANPASPDKKDGQTESFKQKDVEAEMPMVPFVAKDDVAYGEDVSDIGPGGAKHKAARAEKEEQKRILEEKIAAPAAGSPEAKKADEENARAAAASAKALNNFSSAVKKTAAVMVEVAGMVKSGTDSVLDEDRNARLAGMDIGTSRGIRRVLQEGNLSEEASAATIKSAGEQASRFAQDPTSAAAFVEKLTVATRGPGSSSAMQAIDLPNPTEMLNMDGDERIATAMDAINSVSSVKDKQKVADAYGFPHLATANKVTGEAIKTAFSDKADGKIGKARETGTGFEKSRQDIEEVAELPSQIGETGGYIAGITSAIGNLFGSSSGSALTTGAAMLGTKGIAAAGGTMAAAGYVGAAAVTAGAVYGAGKLSEANTAPKGLGDYFGRNVDHVLDFFGSDAADKRLQGVDDFRDGQEELLASQQRAPIPDDKINGPSSSKQSTRGGQGGNKSNIENVDIVVNVMEDKIEAEIKVDGEAYQGANQGFPK